MKIGAISMIRNEADIVEAWVRHQLAMFDYTIVADHMSNDGTYEFLRAVASADDRLRVLRYPETAYDQDLVLNFLRRQVLLDAPDIEWMFICDADEFLDYPSRENLISALSAVESYDLLTFQWQNCYPGATSPSMLSTTQVFMAKRLSTFGKVALRRNIAADWEYLIPKGGHRLHHRLMGSINGFGFGAMLHVPIRSANQIWNKVIAGCESYLHNPGYGGREGIHWFDLLNYMLENPKSRAALPTLVHEYGMPRSKVDLSQVDEHFDDTTLRIASGPLPELVREACEYRSQASHLVDLDRLLNVIRLDRGRFLRRENLQPGTLAQLRFDAA
ncbi:glycosyltransferase family 2 protein [Mesorhizobium marinum]|uniref:Glycosyltransferase family 2 protein n=1 Tax=Mesorhizobium marinum TaxID=3228790 RepID=A0ABV3R5J8_9HYPH